jgi:hypothetical protein
MNTQRGRSLLAAMACLLALGALAACGHTRGPTADTTRQTGQSRDSQAGNAGAGPVSNAGGGGFWIFGHHRDYSSHAPTSQIGVNAFLWRASLDTLDFMPLASADPFGGVIITDWYQNPSTPNERFKATVYILDTHLRADALNVSIFRQTQTGGEWRDAAVDPDTNVQIENAILQRARQLRLSQLHQ